MGKAVGKRDSNRALTLQEQIARFPQLKNAPMAKGMNVTNVHVKFNPMSGPLRNVRCLACGIWGHSRGDRECKKSGWDPFRGGDKETINSDDNSSYRHRKHRRKKKHKRDSSRDRKKRE